MSANNSWIEVKLVPPARNHNNTWFTQMFNPVFVFLCVLAYFAGIPLKTLFLAIATYIAISIILAMLLMAIYILHVALSGREPAGNEPLSNAYHAQPEGAASPL